jgi:hypothetical protein
MEYFYIEKIRNNEQEINFNRALLAYCDNIRCFWRSCPKTTTWTTNYFWNRVRYQMYHALFFNPYCTVDDLSEKQKNLLFSRFGVILFSLSIYLLATNNLTSFDFKVIGL